MKRSELFFSILLLPVDFFMIASAFTLAFIIREQAGPTFYQIPGREFISTVAITIPIWILFFAVSGLYNLHAERNRIIEIGKIITGVSAGLMILVVLDFLNNEIVFPSKSIPVYAWALAILLVFLGRIGVLLLQRMAFIFGLGVRQILLIGKNEITKELLESINHPERGNMVVGIINGERQGGEMNGVSVLGGLTDVEKIIKKNHIDQIIQTGALLTPDEFMDISNICRREHIDFKFIPTQFGVVASNVEIETVDTIPIITLKRTPLDGWGRVIKRLFDMLLAALALILLSPLFVLIAITVKLLDGGQVFYRHLRITRDSKSFRAIKFRSMKPQFCTGPGYKNKSDRDVFEKVLKDQKLLKEFEKDYKLKSEKDPRLTLIGKWLRRTSLDELPQLINVLKGDMSLVGPRPVIKEELERYGKVQYDLALLRPGLTGLWQVSGRSDLTYNERVKLDLYYVEKWSLWMDIVILLKTVTIFFKKGAY